MKKLNFISSSYLRIHYKTTRILLFALVFFLIFIIHLVGYLLIKDRSLYVDEFHYYDQILRFTRGEFTVKPETTVIPGFHLLVALLAHVFQQYSISFIRLISFCLNLFSIPIFYLVAKKLDKEHAMVKTLQYSFFPLFFPFFALIYTDIFSITTLLLSLFFILRKQYNLAGLAGFITLLVRQNNIIWVLFLILVCYYQEYGFRFGRDLIFQFLYRVRVFIIVFLLFIEFIIVNGGLVWGNKTGYPVNYLSIQNVYFMYFLSFFLFLPVLLLHFRKIFQFIFRHKYLSAGAFLMLFVLFMTTFSVTHPWNKGDFQLHNLILEVATTNNLTKSIFFLPMIYAMISMVKTSLYKNYYAWIFPMGILVVLLAWIIEQRYYMVFFALFLLFRKYTTWWMEMVMLIFYLLASFYLFEGVLRWKFFL